MLNMRHGPVVEDPAERQARIDALVDVVVRIYRAPAWSVAHVLQFAGCDIAAAAMDWDLAKALQRRA
jgi:hypothetical protein